MRTDIKMPAGQLNPAGNSWRRLLRVALQPGAHQRDLALLGPDHRFREFSDFRIVAESKRDLGHVNGSLIVRDHAVHQVHIGIPSEGEIIAS